MVLDKRGGTAVSDQAAEIVVYMQPHCASCGEVERFLRERGVPFTVIDISEDPDALEEIISRGYMSTPVTRIGEHWVAGFRKTEFERLL